MNTTNKIKFLLIFTIVISSLLLIANFIGFTFLIFSQFAIFSNNGNNFQFNTNDIIRLIFYFLGMVINVCMFGFLVKSLFTKLKRKLLGFGITSLLLILATPLYILICNILFPSIIHTFFLIILNYLFILPICGCLALITFSLLVIALLKRKKQFLDEPLN